MKTKNILYALLFTLAACNKGENDFLYKADMLPVTLSGFNASSELLEVKIDTFKSELQTGLFASTAAYTFPGNRNSVKLAITEKGTGKEVLERELKRGDAPTTINFFYLDGKVSNMPVAPPAEEGKIKIIYMFQPTTTNYSEPVDIVLGKFYFTPKVFEEITRIKNVKPYEFTEPVTLSTFPTAGQQYNGQPTSVLFLVYIYKAGTNEFYTAGTSYTWNVSSSTAPKPAATTASSKIYVFSENTSGGIMRFDKKLEL